MFTPTAFEIATPEESSFMELINYLASFALREDLKLELKEKGINLKLP